MVGYFLLSFLSFCFFTIVFYANAQVSSAELVSPEQKIIEPTQAIPTPTIFNQQPIQQQAPTIQSNTVTPTPTMYAAAPQVLAATTQAPTPQPTKVLVTPTPTVEPTDTPTPTVTVAPQPTTTTSTDLETLFGTYSAQYSVDEGQLKKIAGCESGFNSAADTGLYAGMFQFSAGTWTSTRTAMGLDPNPDLRKNAGEAIRTAAFMLARGQQNAWPNCH